MTTIKIVVIQR